MSDHRESPEFKAVVRDWAARNDVPPVVLAAMATFKDYRTAAAILEDGGTAQAAEAWLDKALCSARLAT